MASLTGKVAIITRASSEIGEATAIALASQGIKVAIAARRADRLEALAQKIQSSGSEVLTIPVDVTDEAQGEWRIQRNEMGSECFLGGAA
jgi:NADP-dependent 3-hydroxy acid dehydrogenase YdfG